MLCTSMGTELVVDRVSVSGERGQEVSYAMGHQRAMGCGWVRQRWKVEQQATTAPPRAQEEESESEGGGRVPFPRTDFPTTTHHIGNQRRLLRNPGPGHTLRDTRDGAQGPHGVAAGRPGGVF